MLFQCGNHRGHIPLVVPGPNRLNGQFGPQSNALEQVFETGFLPGKRAANLALQREQPQAGSSLPQRGPNEPRAQAALVVERAVEVEKHDLEHTGINS